MHPAFFPKMRPFAWSALAIAALSLLPGSCGALSPIALSPGRADPLDARPLHIHPPFETVRSWNWRKHDGPVIKPGMSGSHDQAIARAAYVAEMGDGTYRMYYTGGPGEAGKLSICIAIAAVSEPTRWRAHPGNPVFQAADGEEFDNRGVDFPNIVRVTDKVWHMYYCGWGTWAEKGRISNRTGLAVSEDGGLTWRRHGKSPILELGEPGSWDSDLTGSVFVLREGRDWRMWYTAGRYTRGPDGKESLNIQIGLALSRDGIRWEKYPKNPVIPTLREKAEPLEYVVSKPNIVLENGLYRMWYSHRGATYRIGYAESRDGIEWERWPGRAGIDVSEQGWDSQFIEYAFVLPYRGGYRMWYTGNGFGATGIGFAVCEP